jgi:F-type H+-transporting ATPase subunit epsilon
MQLKIMLPTQILFEEDVGKVVAEAENGHFGMLPRHIDFATALVPGILVCETLEGDERYVAVDAGILVKCGDEVLVSTRNAVLGDDLDRLRETVRKQYLEIDEKDKVARSALARLEAGVVRRFIELEGRN